MSLDIQDKKYIEDVFDRTRTAFRSDMEHFFGVLREDFDHTFSILVEISKDKPDRGEIREIVREEATEIYRRELNSIIVPCVQDAVRSAVRPYHQDHEKRISKLETVRV